MTVTSTSNGMFAVIQAMAAADAAGVSAQASSVDDLTTSEFMQGLQKILSDYGHNIKAIETFLKNYVASHQTGSAREHMTTESILSLKGMDTLVNKLNDYDTQLSKAKADCDQYTKDVSSWQEKVTAFANGPITYGDWYKYYLGQVSPILLIMPATYATIAGLALKKWLQVSADSAIAAQQLNSAMANQSSAQTRCNDIEKSQFALAAGTSGAMGNHASALSGPAHSVMQTASQMAALGFMFVGLLQNLNNNNPES